MRAETAMHWTGQAPAIANTSTLITRSTPNGPCPPGEPGAAHRVPDREDDLTPRHLRARTGRRTCPTLSKPTAGAADHRSDSRQTRRRAATPAQPRASGCADRAIAFIRPPCRVARSDRRPGDRPRWRCACLAARVLSRLRLLVAGRSLSNGKQAPAPRAVLGRALPVAAARAARRRPP
jgi:hypothetical protein